MTYLRIASFAALVAASFLLTVQSQVDLAAQKTLRLLSYDAASGAYTAPNGDIYDGVNYYDSERDQYYDGATKDVTGGSERMS